MHDDKSSDAESSTTRKPYSTPRLIEFGHIKDIVLGARGKKVDFGGGHSKMCWIAETLYGVDDARVVLLRCWLNIVWAERRRGWILVTLYRTFGRPVAASLSRGWLPATPFRRLFDSLVERALDLPLASLRGR